MSRIHILAVILIMFGGGVAGVTAELSTEHSVDIDDSMTIPAQTVETEWGEATITEVGKEESGENLEVSSNAPENESYAIRIVDSEERNLETEFVDEGGDRETSFLLNRFDPGTYVVALTQDGGDTAVEVEPFIVKAYSIDQSVSDVTEGEPISVDIQLTSVADNPADPQAVNVTLFGDNVTRSVKATETDENSYRAEFSTDGLSTGSYDVYTGVETNSDIYAYNELIGLSDSVSVVVEDTETSTSTPVPADPGETDDASGGGSGVGDSETSSSTAEGTATETTQTSSSQSDGTESTQTESEQRTPETTATETVTQTQSQSTPGNTDSGSTATTGPEAPVFPNGAMIVLFGVLIGILHRLYDSR